MMASPIFHQMLLELDSDRKYDDNDPLILDEDRTAFIDFCMIIHHQSNDQKAVPMSSYAALAVIFHKYSCMTMLERNLAWPLREFVGSSLDQFAAPKIKAKGMRLEDALCISYLSGDSKLFYRCSRFMITLITADRNNGNFKANEMLFDLIPKSLLGEFAIPSKPKPLTEHRTHAGCPNSSPQSVGGQDLQTDLRPE